ncbi:hypothetical protein NLG97_g6887 [Lecanicillium saksenae]|uniref:Uncharacterized protein n=1 Tax=Lecanicillium saksenae TaxID=468837 RepID=A0ACC1QNI5_9HYPO|nr:hypothetical protein NLG97_g6887 [Lecanicillium saksenae]
MRCMLFSLLAAYAAAASVQRTSANGVCTDFAISVEVTAENYDLSALPGFLSNPAALLTSTTLVSLLQNLVFSKIPVSGTETVAGTYCEPSNKSNATRLDTLQLLVHGASYTRDYWRGMAAHYQPGNYSWIDYALAEGYPVLAIDRLGCGLSSHPDPLVTLQMPYQVRTTHAIIEKVRAGATGVLPRAFSKIVYIGHSEGSLLANSLVAQFPNDVDAAVLTGYSSRSLLTALPSMVLALLVPAAVFDPSRFGSFSPGYLVTGSYTGRRNAFYWPGSFDAQLYDFDWKSQGVIGAAEIITALLTDTAAPSFTGSRPDCGSGPESILDRTRSLFPATTNYGYYAVPETGHDVNGHYTARDAFVKAYEFLNSAGF